MNILFISQDIPMNNFSGGAIRSHFILKELEILGSVSVITANDFGVNPRYVEDFASLHRYLGHIDTPYYYADDMHAWDVGRRKLLEITDPKGYDLVVVRYYWLVTALHLLHEPNLVLDCDDCMLDVLEDDPDTDSRATRYIEDIAKIPLVMFAKKSIKLPWLKHFKVYRNCVSKINGVLKEYSTNNKFTVLFVGNLSYAPNYLGLDHFIENVWRDIASHRRDIELKIAGWGLPSSYEQKWSSIPSINYCGYIENIVDAYKDVDVSISPIQSGSGTHIKVMESLLNHTTMVITQWSHRGYEDTLLDGESLLVAADDAEFFSKLIYLMDNREVCRRLAEEGHRQVVAHHAYEGVRGNLAKILLEHAQSCLLLKSQELCDLTP